MTGWLRDHIPFYTQLTEFLKRRKPFLPKDAPRKGRQRRNYAIRAGLHEPTEAENISFKAIQHMFKDENFPTSLPEG